MNETTGSRPEAVLIAGPTASGKSALALRLARSTGGVIINADSMQVYRDLRILTARPSCDDEREVPHRLYGHVDAAEAYSVSRWLADAAAAQADARRRHQLPIFVGGSGLYFKALTQGLSDIPTVPDDVRAEVRRRAAKRTSVELHEELARADPTTATRLRPTDTQRILRALEVFAATGSSLTSFQSRKAEPLLSVSDCCTFTLDVSRAVLRTHIDWRFDAMMAGGALHEVEKLLQRRLDPALPAMRAIGVPELLRHLSHDTSLGEAVTAAKAASRNYIKRQDTFFRTQLPTFARVSPGEAAGRLGLQSA